MPLTKKERSLNFARQLGDAKKTKTPPEPETDYFLQEQIEYKTVKTRISGRNMEYQEMIQYQEFREWPDSIFAGPVWRVIFTETYDITDINALYDGQWGSSFSDWSIISDFFLIREEAEQHARSEISCMRTF